MGLLDGIGQTLVKSALNIASNGGTESAYNESLFSRLSSSLISSTNSDNKTEASSNTLSSKVTNNLSKGISGLLSGDGITKNLISGIAGVASSFVDSGVSSNALSEGEISDFSNEIGGFLRQVIPKFADSDKTTIAGSEISTNDLVNYGISGVTSTLNYAGGMLNNIINTGLSVASGKTTVREATKTFSENSKNLKSTFEKDVDDNTNSMLKKNGVDSKSSAGSFFSKMTSFFTKNVSTFVGSFLTNGLKTIITNPASLANPGLLLGQTFASMLSDKKFIANIVGNLTSTLSESSSSSSSKSTSSSSSSLSSVINSLPQILQFVSKYATSI